MTKQSDPPHETWWRVAGWAADPIGAPEHAEKIGLYLGYQTISGKDYVALKTYPSGEIIHVLPHEIFPTERPEQAPVETPAQLSFF